MRVLFKKTKGGDLIDHLIGWFSRGPYCHVELMFGGAACFSSRAMSGTTFCCISNRNRRWDAIDIPLTSEEEIKVLQWCMKEAGCKYDFRGVIRFVVPFIRPSSKRWFCSEVCTAALQQVGVCMGLKPIRTSPNSLYRYLSRIYK